MWSHAKRWTTASLVMVGWCVRWGWVEAWMNMFVIGGGSVRGVEAWMNGWASINRRGRQMLTQRRNKTHRVAIQGTESVLWKTSCRVFYACICR